jgi:hypothetical protein
MFDDRFGYGFGWFWHIGSFIGGLILVAAIIVVAVLLVRYLIVATRAAQFYLDSHDTVRPAPAAAKPATTATQPAATKPTRTPKTPPPAV